MSNAPQKAPYALTARALLDAAGRCSGDSEGVNFDWWADLADAVGPALLPFVTRPEEYAKAPIEELGLVSTPLKRLSPRRGEMWVLFCIRSEDVAKTLRESPLRSDGFPLILEWRKAGEDSTLLSSAIRTLAAQVRKQLGAADWSIHPAFDRYGDLIDFTDVELFADAEHVDSVASAWGALAAGLVCTTTGRFPPEWSFPSIQWDLKRGCTAPVAGIRQKLSVAADCGANVVTVARSQRREAHGILADLRAGSEGRRFKNLHLYAVRERRAPHDAATEVAFGFFNDCRLRRRILIAILTPLLAAFAFWGVYHWDTHRSYSKYYAAVTYHYGLPEGKYELTPEVQKMRGSTFRFDYNGILDKGSIHRPWLPKSIFGQPRRLVRVVSVNSCDIPESYGDFVFGLIPTVQQFDYQNGQIEKVYCRRRGGDEGVNGFVEKIYHYSDRDGVTNGRLMITSGDGNAWVFADFSPFQRLPDAPTDDKSLIKEYVIERDIMGRMTCRRYCDMGKMPTMDGDGAGGQSFTYHDDGLVAQVRNIGLETTNSVPDRFGVTRQDFYWHNGDKIETSYHDRNGRLVVGRCGFCRRKTTNDCFGNSIRTIFLDVNGNLEYVKTGESAVPCAGVEHVVSNGHYAMSFFLDRYGKRLQGNGVAATRREYNANGDCVGFEFLNGDGNLTPGHDGVARLRYNVDPKTGLCTEVRYYGIDGETPVYGFSERAAIIRYAYDHDANCTEMQLLDEHGRAMIGAAGYATCRISYLNGKIEKIAYLDDKGRPVWHNQDGYACSIWTYKSKTGNVESRRFYADDSFRVLQLNKDGLAGWIAKYDEMGRITQYLFVDEEDCVSASNSYGVAGWKFEYGDFTPEELLPGLLKCESGGKTITKMFLDCDGKTPMCGKNGYAIERQYLDAKGRMIAECFFDANEQRCALKQSEMSAMTWSYGDGGEIQEERYFNCEDLPCLAPDGWGYGTRFLYDERRRERSRIFLGRNGMPANVSAHTYCEERYKYDEYGRVEETSYWTIGEAPALNEENGYHKYKMVRDSCGNPIDFSYFGTNDEPVIGNIHGIRCWRSTCERDTVGNVITEFYFDEYGRRIPGTGESAYFRKNYDSLHRLVWWCWYDAADKPCVNGDGVSRIHTKYYGTSTIVALNEYFAGEGTAHYINKQHGVKRLAEYYENSVETDPSSIRLFSADGKELKSEWAVEVSEIGDYLPAKRIDVRKGDILCCFGDLKITGPCRYRDIRERCKSIDGQMVKQMVLARKEGGIYKIRKFDFGPGPTGVSFKSTKRTEVEFAAMMSAFKNKVGAK